MHYGKYKATVLQVNSNTGAIKVCCEDIYGDYESPWCTPCLPVFKCTCTECKKKTDKERLKEMLPSINSNVWIEFEGGNSAKPIWCGTWVD